MENIKSQHTVSQDARIVQRPDKRYPCPLLNAKENVTIEVIEGALGMINIQASAQGEEILLKSNMPLALIF